MEVTLIVKLKIVKCDVPENPRTASFSFFLIAPALEISVSSAQMSEWRPQNFFKKAVALNN